MIGFGLDCQSILKSGFGFGLTIINLQRIWIGLTIQKNWIEQYPAWYYNTGFGDPKVSAPDPPVEKHCFSVQSFSLVLCLNSDPRF